MRTLRALTLACFGVFACNGAEEAPSQEDDLKAGVQSTLSIPLAEVSGLGRRTVGGREELLALGDSSYRVAVGQVEGKKTLKASFVLVDLEPLLGDYVQSAGSQWEAIASDASGRLFVLEENPGRLFVFDAAGTALEHVASLSVPEEFESTAQDWAKESNSRGEGLVLLANGHVLVAKEKDERLLLELGPAGDAPAGYRRELAVGTSGTFPVPAGVTSELVVLAEWSVGKPNKLADLSDLAIDAAGALFVLSDQGQAYGQLVDPIDPGQDSVDIDDVVKIPSCEKPEGLAFLASGQAVAASDQKSQKNNAVVLKP